MPSKLKRLVWVATMGLASACAAAPTRPPDRPTATLFPLIPTATVTIAQAELVAQPTPGPSPTPLTHLVEQGDTLLGIALQYGVELNDLLVANAGVNPRFLSVGQAILIPGPGGQPAAGLLPTATPVPVELSPVGCFYTLEGSVWCLCTVRNHTGSALEGIVALITLGSAAGEPLRSEPAYAPLNVVGPGQAQLLAAYFPAPVPPFDQAQANLVSAVAAAELQGRYAPVILNVGQSSPGPAHATWDVTGEVELEDFEGTGPLQVYLAIIAFDPLGRPVGFAKYALQAEPVAAFAATVSSLGPTIARIEAYAEAPIPPEADG